MQSVDTKNRRVLVVDDDSASLEIIIEALRWEGFQVKALSDSKKAVTEIKSWGPDLVILDVNMPGMNGIETLKEVRQQNHYVSVMFVSGHASTDAIIKGLDAGADDYIAKPFVPLEFLARVRAQMRIKDLNDQLRAMNERLKELVDTDDLTGLFNMRSLYQKLDVELARARRYFRQVGVVMLDMDYFKSVNDGHDHLFGSYVLSEVGAIIRNTIRATDLGARYGGDEFLIVLTEITEDGARAFCERLRKRIEETVFENGKDRIQLTASLGFSITDTAPSGVDPRNLVRTADVALYEAKGAGRNCVRYQALQDHVDHRKDKTVASAQEAKARKAG